jgi:hypothetical protein
MALSRVSEYLLAQRDDGGNMLVTGGISQVVTVVPPLATLTFRVTPWNEYFQIYCSSRFDPSMVPNAFYAYAQYYGSRQYDAIITGSMTSQPVDFYAPVSHAVPAVIYIQNLTGLNQYYASEVFYIGIRNEEAYWKVVAALNRLETSEKLQALAVDAGNLVKLLLAAKQAIPAGGM